MIENKLTDMKGMDVFKRIIKTGFAARFSHGSTAWKTFDKTMSTRAAKFVMRKMEQRALRKGMKVGGKSIPGLGWALGVGLAINSAANAATSEDMVLNALSALPYVGTPAEAKLMMNEINREMMEEQDRAFRVSHGERVLGHAELRKYLGVDADKQFNAMMETALDQLWHEGTISNPTDMDRDEWWDNLDARETAAFNRVFENIYKERPSLVGPTDKILLQPLPKK